ncbi:hypothetical protein HS041_31485 [Planomonospora sp. ID67723]|uniref:hypothetical protein n=1 Tax=Planomonospora sp. ID67723 TaxID=2738134 RepID=UPI0018C39FC0|nr:hypothetical protein [Planomonospora sp. ID67723]MBG0832232.1 hypothetical protein [Planomonospora sp. ID67723]
MVVLAAQEPGCPRRVLSLGEAKWGETMNGHHVERLARARDLLGDKGYETRDTVLACYSGSGFTDDLRQAAEEDDRLRLIGLNALYRPC